jgi:hypothetical protein
VLRRTVIFAVLATAGANTYFLWQAGRPGLAVVVGALIPAAAIVDVLLTLREPGVSAEKVALRSLIALLVVLCGFAVALEP